LSRGEGPNYLLNQEFAIGGRPVTPKSKSVTCFGLPDRCTFERRLWPLTASSEFMLTYRVPG